MKRYPFALLLLAVMPLCLCGCQENIEVEELSFTRVETALPTGKSSYKIKQATGFDYGSIVYIGEENLSLLAVDGNLVYLEKFGGVYNDKSTLSFYTYDLATDTLTQLDGTISDYNCMSGTQALVGNRMYSILESFDERIRYVLDTEKNTVEVTSREALNVQTESFYYTYAMNETDYIEHWFDIGERTNVYHVKYCTPKGGKEIIKQQADSTTENYTYIAAGGSVYEYAEKNSGEITMSRFDASGKRLRTIALPEFAHEMQTLDNTYAGGFHVIGGYTEVDLKIGNDTRCFLYHLPTETLRVLDNCALLSPSNTAEEAPAYYVLTHDTVISPVETALDLYRMDERGNLELIISDLDGISASPVTDGKTLVFLKDQQLYSVKL